MFTVDSAYVIKYTRNLKAYGDVQLLNYYHRQKIRLFWGAFGFATFFFTNVLWLIEQTNIFIISTLIQAIVLAGFVYGYIMTKKVISFLNQHSIDSFEKLEAFHENAPKRA